MRSSYSVTQLLLLPLLLLLLCLCGLSPAAALSPLDACLTNFTQLDATNAYFVFRTVAFACPAGCLSVDDGSRVQGSYPYSGASSICLSAIHCGVLDASLGGSVFVSRFYRADWSGGDTQTIFPHNSSIGVLSNGVNSSAVPSGSYTVPSTGSEYSYVVRGRGELLVQPRVAPFPPRSGHLHAVWPTQPRGFLADTQRLYYSFHLIVGGFNGSHYLNVSAHSTDCCSRSASGCCASRRSLPVCCLLPAGRVGGRAE